MQQSCVHRAHGVAHLLGSCQMTVITPAGTCADLHHMSTPAWLTLHLQHLNPQLSRLAMLLDRKAATCCLKTILAPNARREHTMYPQWQTPSSVQCVAFCLEAANGPTLDTRRGLPLRELQTSSLLPLHASAQAIYQPQIGPKTSEP